LNPDTHRVRIFGRGKAVAAELNLNGEVLSKKPERSKEALTEKDGRQMKQRGGQPEPEPVGLCQSQSLSDAKARMNALHSEIAEAVPPSHTENTGASLHVTNDADHIDIHYTCEVASFGASECLKCTNQEVVLRMGSQESKAWKDKIVIFERGTMTFVAMALQAQESEAKAVVVINSDDESFVPGSEGEDTSSIWVPVVCVSKSNGGKLKSMLGSTNRGKMRATLQFSIEVQAEQAVSP